VVLTNSWVIAAALILAACSLARVAAITAGPDLSAPAADIAGSVSVASDLSPACTKAARLLAEASLRATAGLPSAAQVGRDQEASALDTWERLRCPLRALPGVAFGVAQARRTIGDIWWR